MGQNRAYDSLHADWILTGVHLRPPNGREFLYVQIGDDALRGRTNPVRIPFWVGSVTVLGRQKRKLRRIVSDKQMQSSPPLAVVDLFFFDDEAIGWSGSAF